MFLTVCEGLTGLTPCLLPEVTVDLAKNTVIYSLEPTVEVKLDNICFANLEWMLV